MSSNGSACTSAVSTTTDCPSAAPSLSATERRRCLPCRPPHRRRPPGLFGLGRSDSSPALANTKVRCGRETNGKRADASHRHLLLRLGWCGLLLAVSRLRGRNAIGFVSKFYSFIVSFSVSLLLVAITIGKKIDQGLGAAYSVLPPARFKPTLSAISRVSWVRFVKTDVSTISAVLSWRLRRRTPGPPPFSFRKTLDALASTTSSFSIEAESLLSYIEGSMR